MSERGESIDKRLANADAYVETGANVSGAEDWRASLVIRMDEEHYDSEKPMAQGRFEKKPDGPISRFVAATKRSIAYPPARRPLPACSP